MLSSAESKRMHSHFMFIASFLKVSFVLYSGLLLLILIHELGHLIAGLICGFGLVRIRVGPIGFKPCGKFDKQPSRWIWHHKVSDFGSGSVLMFANARALSRTASRCFLLLLAGPAANLASAFSVLPIARQETTAGGIAKYFVAGSILLVLGNLLPLKGKHFESDGRKLIGLLFSPQARKRIVFRLTLVERIRDVQQLFRRGEVRLSCERAEEIAIESQQFPELIASAAYRRHLADFRNLFQEIATQLSDSNETTEATHD